MDPLDLPPLLKDLHLNEEIGEDLQLWGSSEHSAYKLIGKSCSKTFLDGLNALLDGFYDQSIIDFKAGGFSGDPLSTYILYKAYATENPFLITPDLRKAWYYLICSRVLGENSMVLDPHCVIQSESYHKKFDNENFQETFKVIEEGTQDDFTCFKNHKPLLLLLAKQIWTPSDEIDAQILSYFNSNAQANFPQELIMIQKIRSLRFKQLDEIINEMKSQIFKQYIINFCKERLMLFNFSGVFISDVCAKAQVNNFMMIVFYLIFLGKRTDEDFEEVLVELYKYCQLCVHFNEIKLTPAPVPEAQWGEGMKNLRDFAACTLAYLYTTGHFIKKNVNKAQKCLEYVKDYKPTGNFSHDYLYVYCLYKQTTVQGEFAEKAEALLGQFTKGIDVEKVLEQGANEKKGPEEYYLTGFIAEKILNQKDLAIKCYEAGAQLASEALEKVEITFLYAKFAFARKCKSKISKEAQED